MGRERNKKKGGKKQGQYTQRNVVFHPAELANKWFNHYKNGNYFFQPRRTPKRKFRHGTQKKADNVSLIDYVGTK